LPEHEIVNGLSVLDGLVKFFLGWAEKTGFIWITVSRRPRGEFGGGHVEFGKPVLKARGLRHETLDIVDFLEHLAAREKEPFHGFLRCLLAMIDAVSRLGSGELPSRRALFKIALRGLEPGPSFREVKVSHKRGDLFSGRRRGCVRPPQLPRACARDVLGKLQTDERAVSALRPAHGFFVAVANDHEQSTSLPGVGVPQACEPNR
jgi:hypothetical protein